MPIYRCGLPQVSGDFFITDGRACATPGTLKGVMF